MVSHGLFAAGDEGVGLSIPKLLYAFLGAPVLWALHLSLSYFLLTVDCIGPWDGARWALALVTAACAAGSAGAGWVAYRLWRRLGPDRLRASERDWARFLAVAGVGASALFTLVILAEGIAPYLVRLCR